MCTCEASPSLRLRMALMETHKMQSALLVVLLLSLLVLTYITMSRSPFQSPESSRGICDRAPMLPAPEACKIPLTPGHLKTKHSTERLRAGEAFEIVFSRHLFSTHICSPPEDPQTGRDIFAASVQRLNKETQEPDVIANATVTFLRIAQDPASGNTSAEYSISGRIYDAGTYTVKLLQMYHSVSENGLASLLMDQSSSDDELRSVHFLQGFSPLAFGEVQWGWSDMWAQTWELQVTEAEQRMDESRQCDEIKRLFVGRWIRNDGRLRWSPYGCAIGTDLSCFKVSGFVDQFFPRHASLQGYHFETIM